MADKKAPPTSSEDGHSIAYKVLMYFFLLLVLSGFITKFGFDRYIDSVNSKLESNSVFNENQNSNNEEQENLGLFDLFSTGKISLGGMIANKKEVEVRNLPAGQLLGLQKKGEIAQVLEGPVVKGSYEWWRVDYKNAPDGWIKGNDVTTYVTWFKILNFFPWLFNGLQKILILIGIITLILIIIVSLKHSNLKKIQKQKEELKKEQAVVYTSSPKISHEKEVDELPIPGLPIGDAPATENVTNRRWKNVQTLTQSHNINDWKQAIIESDIMLDEMLDKMGYHGDSVGDKLKQIEPSDFLTLNQAWEAHKVRNHIAHKGANYILSKDEAERVVGLYGEVFREFYYI